MPHASLTVRNITAQPVVLKLKRPVVARIATITEWPLILIDLLTEEGIVGRSYLEPYIVKSMRYLVPALKDFGPGQRFMTCVRFNARKSDGKYNGAKEGVAVYVSGKLDRFFDVPKEAREMCKDAVYAPFPELEALKR